MVLEGFAVASGRSPPFAGGRSPLSAQILGMSTARVRPPLTVQKRGIGGRTYFGSSWNRSTRHVHVNSNFTKNIGDGPAYEVLLNVIFYADKTLCVNGPVQ